MTTQFTIKDTFQKQNIRKIGIGVQIPYCLHQYIPENYNKKKIIKKVKPTQNEDKIINDNKSASEQLNSSNVNNKTNQQVQKNSEKINNKKMNSDITNKPFIRLNYSGKDSHSIILPHRPNKMLMSNTQSIKKQSLHKPIKMPSRDATESLRPTASKNKYDHNIKDKILPIQTTTSNIVNIKTKQDEKILLKKDTKSIKTNDGFNIDLIDNFLNSPLNINQTTPQLSDNIKPEQVPHDIVSQEELINLIKCYNEIVLDELLQEEMTKLLSAQPENFDKQYIIQLVIDDYINLDQINKLVDMVDKQETYDFMKFDMEKFETNQKKNIEECYKIYKQSFTNGKIDYSSLSEHVKKNIQAKKRIINAHMIALTKQITQFVLMHDTVNKLYKLISKSNSIIKDNLKSFDNLNEIDHVKFKTFEFETNKLLTYNKYLHDAILNFEIKLRATETVIDKKNGIVQNLIKTIKFK